MAEPASLPAGSSLSPLQHTAIGAMAGIVEVLVMQPTVALKNALQEGRPLPATPAAYYRGLLVNAGSIAPITAIQFGAHRALEQALAAHTDGELGGGLKIAAAAGAGAASSIVGCPAELIMIQQQKAGRSLAGEARHFLATHGARRLYRGLIPTATRDGIYTAGYLGLSPALQEYLDGAEALRSTPAAARFVMAGAASGTFAAIVTQPVDTIKTRMQAFVDVRQHPQYAGVLPTARHLVATQGVASLWAGLLPRLVRLSGATVLLQLVRSALIDLLEGQHSERS